MRTKLVPCAAALLCLLCRLPAGAGVKQVDLPAYILAEHRVVLQKWLRLKPHLRPATEQDMENPELLKTAREGYTGKPFEAFYSVADFNRDGHKDFAVGLINSKKKKNLAVAVFNGPFGKERASAPTFYDETSFDRDDFLILVGDDWNELQIGMGSDARTVLLKPKGRRYVIWAGATQ